MEIINNNLLTKIILIINISFIPGYFFSLIIFPINKNELNVFERLVISFALSMSIIPLLYFIFYLIGIKNVTYIEILIVNIILFLMILLNNKIRK